MQVDVELYRSDVRVQDKPPVALSVIEIAPEQPKRTMLFIHGFGGQASQWARQLSHFSRDARVIAYDLRGHGQSDKPNSQYTMAEIQQDLETLIARLRLPERFILLSHSFGGAIAAQYAANHPERVERLVLIGTASEFRLNRWAQLPFKLPAAWLAPLWRVARRTLSAPPHVAKTLYHNALTAWNGATVFPKIQTLTLVVTGYRDRLFPTAAFEDVPELIPGAQQIKVPVSAHMVMIERAEAVNRAIERFLVEPTASQVGRPAARISARPMSSPRGRYPTRPWLRFYDEGVPYTVSLPERPLFRFLERAARRFPLKTAVRFPLGGANLTYRRLERHANRCATALRKLGVQRGDRVMILLPNVPQAVIAFYGALKAGAVVVACNPLFDQEELLRQARDSGARVLISLDRLRSVAAYLAAEGQIERVIETRTDDYFSPWRKALYAVRFRPVSNEAPETFLLWGNLMRETSPQRTEITVEPHDLAVIQYTGGTTSKPKGVMLTHANLVANTLQTRHWLSDMRDGKESFLCVLPFSHIYGMTTAMHVPIALGATLILLPTFEVNQVLKAIKRYRPSAFPGVPAMYVAINNAPNVRRYNISSVKFCISGAAPLPVEVAEEFEKLTKGRLIEGYGLTEAAPVTHANPFKGQRRVGTIGVPLPNTEARITDLQTGEDLPPGEVGELLVRGPQVMAGYWNLPQATLETLTTDGAGMTWLRTGDLARMDDDGYFEIVNRRQEIWYADEAMRNPIFPREIEEVLYEHPKIKEVVVVPIGRTPKAFIVLREGETASVEEVIAYCRARMEEAMVPALIEFRQDLPKSFVGKVLRRLLVDQVE